VALNASVVVHLPALASALGARPLGTLFQRCFNAVSTLFQRCFNAVLTLFQRCFNAVLMLFQRCFNPF